jgi:hypothetical protein
LWVVGCRLQVAGYRLQVVGIVGRKPTLHRSRGRSALNLEQTLNPSQPSTLSQPPTSMNPQRSAFSFFAASISLGNTSKASPTMP